MLNKRTLAAATVIVNLAVPAVAAEPSPSLEECELNFVQWAFGTLPIITGFLRTRDDMAIALNEEVVDALDDAEAEHVQKCLDVLMHQDDGTEVPIEPENWPYRPEEEI